jgi:dTDP-glucose 4,6-dehydratase
MPRSVRNVALYSEKKRVLLTGAAGFAGSHMLRAILKETNWDVVCLSSFRHKGLQDRIKSSLSGDPDWLGRVTVILQDLVAPISALTSIQFGKIDYVINFASESHVDRSIQNPEKFILNNVSLMTNMLEWARRQDISSFIQISTDEVYGDHGLDDPSKEWQSILLPSNPYSASKAAQESICVSYSRTYGLPLTITNTVNMFGEMQDPEKFVPQLISKIQSGQKILIHAANESEIGSRVYLHARNNADAILFLLGYRDSDLLQKFHISSDDILSNLDIAEQVSHILNKRLDYELDYEIVNRPGHDFHYALDGSNLKNKGWSQPENFQKSLESVVSWYLKNPEWLDPANF